MVDELLFEDYTNSFYPTSDELYSLSGGPPIYLNPKILEITDWLKTNINYWKKESVRIENSSVLYSCLRMLQSEDYFYSLISDYPNIKHKKGIRGFKDFIFEKFGYEIGWVGGGKTSDKVFEKISLLKDISQPINSALVQTHQYRFRRYGDSRYQDQKNDLWMLKDIQSDWVFAPNLFVLKPSFTLSSFMNWDKAPF